MPAGANAKREREFKELTQKFKKSHRYPGRAEQVAARIVNKQRAEYGETKGAKQKDRAGASPDKDLPIRHYQQLTIPQIAPQLDKLDTRQLRKIRGYEAKHKNRKGIMQLLDRKLARH